MENAIFESERDIKTFVDLFHGSNILLEKSIKTKEGSYFTTMGSLLLTAFAFEAYLNHLGKEKISFWEEIEKTSIDNKYKILRKEFSITVNNQPYQTFKDLFKFRNSIAHGRSQILKEKKMISATDDILKHEPKTSTEEFCTEKNAIRAREDIELLITELNIESGLGSYPFTSGLSTNSITLKNLPD